MVEPVSFPIAAMRSGLMAFSELMTEFENKADNLYQSLRLNLLGYSQQAFEYAITGLDKLVKMGKIEHPQILSIVDFSQPSSHKRMVVIDLQKKLVLFNTYVAHGRNSGNAFARDFSNTPETNKSSLGFYETSHTYIGGNGYSLRLEGLEKGFNDNAASRAIVVHGAAYVSASIAQQQGYIGRSQGCPALPLLQSKPIIDKIKNGTCLFVYSPNAQYIQQSKLLH